MAAGGMTLNIRLMIPPGEANHEVIGSQTLTADTLLTSMTPHMHVRGKDMKYVAHFPDGTSETLLWVPKYNFDWQITYQLAEPRLLPTEVIAHFDNSANNKFNPDPTKTVRWGDQTWEEMMIGFYGTVAEAAGETKPVGKQ
jgi:hypothetical protein